MQRKEMVLECSKLWDDIKWFIEDDAGKPAESLSLETTLEEAGIDEFTFDKISEDIMAEYDEATGMAIAEECETMKDIYDVMFQQLVDSYSWDNTEMEVWNFVAECAVRNAHPEKTLNGITFTPDEVQFDLLLNRGFGFSQSDVDAVIDEANRNFGVSVPKEISPKDMIGTLFDRVAYEVEAKEQEKLEAEEKEKEERSAKIAEEREAMRQRQAERKQKKSCLQTLGYAFLLYLLPFLIFAGILALIFSHIY